MNFNPFLVSLNLRTSSDIHGFLLLLLCSRMFDAADRMDSLNATKLCMAAMIKMLSFYAKFESFINIFK